jgi:hypothetical protein
MKKRRKRLSQNGYSLLESLLSLVIFLLIILGSMEFFATIRTVFFRLQAKQETRQSAWIALEKIRTDLLLAGQGLTRPIRMGLVAGVENKGEIWILVRANRSLSLISDPIAGGTSLEVLDADEDMSGRSLCLFDETKGETILISTAGDGRLTPSAPLRYSYRAEEAKVIVLQKTSIYLDSGKNVLRHKTDGASAQPLLEDVHSFALSFDQGTCLAAAQIAFSSAPEDFYEIKIMARNVALGKSP